MSVEQSHGCVAEAVATTLTIGNLESLLPCRELLSLRLGATRLRSVVVERKVEVQIQTCPDLPPHPVPFRQLRATAPCSSGLPRLSSVTSGGAATGWIRKVVQILQTCLAIPDLGRIVEAGAKDVDGTITGVAEHDVVLVVDDAAHQTWLVDVGKILLGDQGWIDVGLLLLVLHGV